MTNSLFLHLFSHPSFTFSLSFFTFHLSPLLTVLRIHLILIRIRIHVIFPKVQNWGLGVKKFFFGSFWLIFYPLDPDPDPGSQNLADPTDPDPKYCLREKKVFRFFLSHWSTKKSYKFSKNIEESCTNRVQFCTKRRKSDIF